MPRAVTVTLPDELAQLLDAKLKSGEYTDESAVLCEGLRSLDSDDQEIEMWLQNEVAATYDRVKSGSAKLYTAAEVFDGMEARYLARKAAQTE